MSNKAYPSDLSNQEWEIIKPLVPSAKHGGRHRSVEIRQILFSILLVNV